MKRQELPHYSWHKTKSSLIHFKRLSQKLVSGTINSFTNTWNDLNSLRNYRFRLIILFARRLTHNDGTSLIRAIYWSANYHILVPEILHYEKRFLILKTSHIKESSLQFTLHISQFSANCNIYYPLTFGIGVTWKDFPFLQRPLDG